MSEIKKKNSFLKNSKITIVGIIILSLAFVVSIGYVTYYFVYTIPPTSTLESSLDSYQYRDEKNWYLFTGDVNAEREAVVLFTKPRVGEKSYFQLATNLQKKGHNVFIIKSTVNQPMLNWEVVAKAKKAYPKQNKWFVGGHDDASHAVDRHVIKKRGSTAGAFYLGGTPSEKAVATGLPLMIIEGSYDVDSTFEPLDDENVATYIIDGARKDQFSYQDTIKPGTVTNLDRRTQQRMTADRIVDFIYAQR